MRAAPLPRLVAEVPGFVAAALTYAFQVIQVWRTRQARGHLGCTHLDGCLQSGLPGGAGHPKDFGEDRTVIVIARGLSTVGRLDRILVFDRGGIVEDGSHEDLLSRRGAHHRLWNQQSWPPSAAGLPFSFGAIPVAA